jgi:hypothetical protein
VQVGGEQADADEPDEQERGGVVGGDQRGEQQEATAEGQSGRRARECAFDVRGGVLNRGLRSVLRRARGAAAQVDLDQAQGIEPSMASSKTSTSSASLAMRKALSGRSPR